MAWSLDLHLVLHSHGVQSQQFVYNRTISQQRGEHSRQFVRSVCLPCSCLHHHHFLFVSNQECSKRCCEAKAIENSNGRWNFQLIWLHNNVYLLSVTLEEENLNSFSILILYLSGSFSWVLSTLLRSFLLPSLPLRSTYSTDSCASYPPIHVRSLRVWIWGIVPMKTTLLQLKDEENNVIQLRFPKHKLADLLSLYKVGQYIFVNFPGISMLEWHPYSISSGPEERTIEIHIKGGK